MVCRLPPVGARHHATKNGVVLIVVIGKQSAAKHCDINKLFSLDINLCGAGVVNCKFVRRMGKLIMLFVLFYRWCLPI